MVVSGVTAAPTRETFSLRKALALIKPADSAQREIRALDGLRAIAALTIVLYHICLVSQFKLTQIGSETQVYWTFLGTGVRLFFVLSGFLLFLPYARAMLRDKPLPSALSFYKRRALRILPAYYVCFAILAVLPTSIHTTYLDWKDVGTHLLFIHDTFPFYNRDLNGPFWTLAVEFQFYLLLPLIALVMARVVGKSKSYIRLIGCIVALIVAELIVRKIDGVFMGNIPMYSTSTPLSLGIERVFVQVTYGMQGKFFEVFGVGMLCAVIYILTVEMQMLTTARLKQYSWLLLVIALVVLFLTMLRSGLSEAMFFTRLPRGWDYGLYSFAVGVGYGALLLAILWGGKFIRAAFEWTPLRYIGLISFSLYLWHLPVINGSIPGLATLPFALRVVAAFAVAYASYQLIERPFLRRRRSASRQKQGEQGKQSEQRMVIPASSQGN